MVRKGEEEPELILNPYAGYAYDYPFQRREDYFHHVLSLAFIFGSVFAYVCVIYMGWVNRC